MRNIGKAMMTAFAIDTERDIRRYYEVVPMNLPGGLSVLLIMGLKSDPPRPPHRADPVFVNKHF